MGCDSPLKGWRDRDTGGITFRRERSFGEKMEVGCGQCLGCRLDYSRMWAMRIIHEAQLYQYGYGNSFVTLTYRNRYDCSIKQLEEGLHVPSDWSLHERHMTLFLKKLRDKFDDREIRYFYAGEYGRMCKHGIDVNAVGCPICNHGRPHFHACLFNVQFPDLEAYETDGGITRHTSPMLEKLWGYGFVDVGELNYQTAGYAAKYCLKKMNGVAAEEFYETLDEDGNRTFIQPEFVRMSRGNASHKGKSCGIGAAWLERYGGDVFPSDEVPVPGHGVQKGVPRYYDKILEKENPELYEDIKKKRRDHMNANKEEFTHQRLMAKHKVKKARVEMFKKDKL